MEREREKERGSKEKRRRRHDPSDTLALPPPFSLSTIPWMNAFLPRRMQRVHFSTLKIRARGAIAFYESTCEVALRTLLKRFVRVRFLKLYSRARVKDE